MVTVEAMCSNLTRITKEGMWSVAFVKPTKAVMTGAPCLGEAGLTLVCKSKPAPFVPGRLYEITIKEVE